VLRATSHPLATAPTAPGAGHAVSNPPAIVRVLPEPCDRVVPTFPGGNMTRTTSTRRQWLGTVSAFSVLALGGCASFRPGSRTATAQEALAALERGQGGRLGVSAIDTGSRRSVHWRADERFAMCSTFKLLLAATVLQAVDTGELDAAELLAFDERDRVSHAPVIDASLAAGVSSLTAVELARATQTTSDNVAANLLIRRLGGPASLTAHWRTWGDPVTRLDRYEPAMNLSTPGDVRDTTTPRAMATTVGHLIAGQALRASSRDRLGQWLIETQTGLRRLRAGLPDGWRAGDKTGTGIHPSMANKSNDVAVAWPPGRAPIIIAAYYEADGHYPKARAQDDAVLAQVGRIVADAFA